MNELLFTQPHIIADSIVVDMGGHEGDFASEIIRRYNPMVVIYEPVPEFCDKMRQRFAANPKVWIRQMAVSDCGGSQRMRVDGNISGFHCQSGREIETLTIAAELTCIHENVALLKINVEGGEYRILRRLIERECMPRIEVLQVQWHRCHPDADALRIEIAKDLWATHCMAFAFPSIREEWENWENWVRR